MKKRDLKKCFLVVVRNQKKMPTYRKKYISSTGDIVVYQYFVPKGTYNKPTEQKRQARNAKVVCPRCNRTVNKSNLLRHTRTKICRPEGETQVVKLPKLIMTNAN